MLSSLPKLADKAFVLGFLLPTLLFTLATISLFSDQQWTAKLVAALVEKDGLEKFVYFALAVWSASIFLMMLNHTLFQMLEGYFWPVSRLFGNSERGRFRRNQDRFDALNAEWTRLGDTFSLESQAETEALRQKLVREFPLDQNDHLPTRFGNAIRAFEVYSKELYGADSIPLWLHLSAVLPKEFQTALDDARAQVNCVVNVCFFAMLFALVAMGRLVSAIDMSKGICTAILMMTLPPNIWFLSTIILAIGVSYLAYLLSIQLVYAWGDLVKAAFDCYLPALAEKLGYKLPESGEERKAFWTAVSRQAIYWMPLSPEQWKPAKKSSPANGAALARNEILKLLKLLKIRRD